jgi:hypothetical protein
MEQAAPPGALRISHDAYVQVRGIFEVEVQEPIAVKGVDAPIQSYLGAARQAEAVPSRQPRHRRGDDADDRPRRRAAGAAGGV